MLQRYVSPFREFGLTAGLLYALSRVLAKTSPHLRLDFYEFTVQPITEKPLLRAGRAARFEFRAIGPHDPALARMPPPAAVLRDRYAQGASCLGAFRADELVAYMWFCPGRYDEDEVRCTYVLAPHGVAVFDFDFYVFPEHRMGFAFAALWNEANRVLHGRGIRYTYSRLTRYNEASRRAHAHLGWKRVAQAVFLQLGPLQIMASTLFPYLHAAWGRSRVLLNLRPDALLAGR